MHNAKAQPLELELYQRCPARSMDYRDNGGYIPGSADCNAPLHIPLQCSVSGEQNGCASAADHHSEKNYGLQRLACVAIHGEWLPKPLQI